MQYRVYLAIGATRNCYIVSNSNSVHDAVRKVYELKHFKQHPDVDNFSNSRFETKSHLLGLMSRHVEDGFTDYSTLSGDAGYHDIKKGHVVVVCKYTGPTLFEQAVPMLAKFDDKLGRTL